MICFRIFLASFRAVASPIPSMHIPISVRFLTQFLVNVAIHISFAPGLVRSCRHFLVVSSSTQLHTCSMFGLIVAPVFAVSALRCSIVSCDQILQRAFVTTGLIAMFSFPYLSVLSMIVCIFLIISFLTFFNFTFSHVANV